MRVELKPMCLQATSDGRVELVCDCEWRESLGGEPALADVGMAAEKHRREAHRVD